ncbi:hypothetical protein C6361_28510 [Plantactinospora sp. BC1]|uniref:hypothetical protein n=1 Tax=Plantactinospora sp. BC1 TaxID=2108470 RepID=UPI000D167234|nr:hypothetical protein [Plantactinospora sp. BC1]AVT32752.1 hypothetical protein C6361_28510 [Plantactinospora sp. BC1]
MTRGWPDSADDEEALAEAFGEAAPATGVLDARLAAGQVVAVQRILARENWQRLSAGRTAAEVYPEAVAAADGGFRLLATGLTAYADPGGSDRG